MAAKKEEQMKIRTLLASEIECRVGMMKRDGCSLLLYKDARVDMRLLDEIYGPNNWQRSHELINGNLFCTISIWDTEKKEWVKKQDVGTESNTEKEKGQASDAFKRAGFNWGIGRELYTGPFVWIRLDASEVTEKNGSYATYTRFKVKSIGYSDQREIDRLVIVDGAGKVRYTFGNVDEKVVESKQQDSPQKTGETTGAFTGGQLKQAVEEITAAKNRSEVDRTWKKYSAMQNNGEFRDACIGMCKKYPKAK